jgi:hypothetical protein
MHEASCAETAPSAPRGDTSASKSSVVKLKVCCAYAHLLDNMDDTIFDVDVVSENAVTGFGDSDHTHVWTES